MNRYNKIKIILLFNLCFFFSDSLFSSEETFYPEIDEVDMLLSHPEKPEGVVFHTMEQQTDAMETLLPRVIFYTQKIRSKYPALEIAIVSHGDEILSFKKDDPEYSSLHQMLKEFIANYEISYHLCGTFLKLNDLEESDFADHFDIVPFGPSQISDYREVGYKTIGVEIEW